MAEWARSGSAFPEAVARLPGWLAELAHGLPDVEAEHLTRFVPPHGEGRHSAVLILFSGERDLLLIQRSSTMRSHAGQPAFPGGAVDDDDEDAIAAAVREAEEETGLDPAGVLVFGTLPDFWIPISNYVVTPVLGWWHTPSAVTPQDRGEVAAVSRIPLADLVNPANRCQTRHPNGFTSPGFTVGGMLVWGFTGGLISSLLDRFGWAVPWDQSRVVALPLETPDP